MGQRLGKSNGSILGKFDGSVVSEGREGKKNKRERVSFYERFGLAGGREEKQKGRG